MSFMNNPNEKPCNPFYWQMAAAAALGAFKLNRPVRLVLDMKTNMELIGKRYPYLIKYNVSDLIMNRLQKNFCQTSFHFFLL